MKSGKELKGANLKKGEIIIKVSRGHLSGKVEIQKKGISLVLILNDFSV